MYCTNSNEWCQSHSIHQLCSHTPLPLRSTFSTSTDESPAPAGNFTVKAEAARILTPNLKNRIGKGINAMPRTPKRAPAKRGCRFWKRDRAKEEKAAANSERMAVLTAIAAPACNAAYGQRSILCALQLIIHTVYIEKVIGALKDDEMNACDIRKRLRRLNLPSCGYIPIPSGMPAKTSGPEVLT